METRSHRGGAPTPDKRQPESSAPPPPPPPLPPAEGPLPPPPPPKDEASSDSTYASLEPRRPMLESPPATRRRRPRSSQSMEMSASAIRVAKRPSGTGPGAIEPPGARKPYPAAMHVSEDAIPITPGNRAFPCPLAIYGCVSTFGSKNEWKRHVNTQHMRLGFWRCDQCPTDGNRGPNDFNRKDLFIQHIRRMHSGSFRRSSATKPGKDDAEEQALQEIATRCYRHIRSPPEQSACLFCEQQFHGIGSWDDRMEHVGRHMEVAKREGSSIAGPHDWRADESTHLWMANEQIIGPHGEQWVLQDLDAQNWPGNPPPNGAVQPMGTRAPRQSIPGKRSSSYHYVPIREANHIPHGSNGEQQQQQQHQQQQHQQQQHQQHQMLQPLHPKQQQQPPPPPPQQYSHQHQHHQVIAPSPSPAMSAPRQPIQPQPQPHPKPRDSETHNIGLVSGPNGMLPYMQESEDERPAKRQDRHYSPRMAPSQRPLPVDCEWQDCNRRGMYGFNSAEDMVDHMRDAHRHAPRSETRQSSPHDYHTPPQLLAPGGRRYLTQEEAYRAQEAERARQAAAQPGPWNYSMAPERPREPHVMVNGMAQDGMRRASIPEHARAMPPMRNGHAQNFSQGGAEDRAREVIVIPDSRADTEMYDADPAPSQRQHQHPTGPHPPHDPEDPSTASPTPSQDDDDDATRSAREEAPVISHYPRWRDAYGFKYCSAQDLSENDIYALRERSQDLEMVLANVWQAFTRTGSHDAHPWSPLAQLVRRFAPNVLVTAAQPGGAGFYRGQ